MLRRFRAGAARVIAAWAARGRRRERRLIALGCFGRRHSWLLGSLYWHALADLRARLRAGGDVYRPMRFGHVDLLADVTDPAVFHEYFFGAAYRYEPGLVALLLHRLRAGDVFVDVGANTGFFTVLAARLVGEGGRVAAFEPHPEARAAMIRVIEANGARSIVDVSAAAVSSRTGTATFHMSSADSVLSSLEPGKAPLGRDYPFDRTASVDTLTLDLWAASHPDLAARVSVIKIDVEGAEDTVVAGSAAFLRAHPRVVVVCETTRASEADAALRALGMTGRPLDVSEAGFGNYVYERPGSSEPSSSPAQQG